jgi:hypothetical protein
LCLFFTTPTLTLLTCSNCSPSHFHPGQQLLALAGLLASPIGVSDQTRVDFLKTLGRSAIKVPKKDDDAMDTVIIATLVVAGLFLRTC